MLFICSSLPCALLLHTYARVFHPTPWCSHNIAPCHSPLVLLSFQAVAIASYSTSSLCRRTRENVFSGVKVCATASCTFFISIYGNIESEILTGRSNGDFLALLTMESRLLTGCSVAGLALSSGPSGWYGWGMSVESRVACLDTGVVGVCGARGDVLTHALLGAPAINGCTLGAAKVLMMTVGYTLFSSCHC